jgi:hypothetical protein
VTTNHARYAAEIMALLRMMVRLGLDRTGGPAPVHHRPPPKSPTCCSDWPCRFPSEHTHRLAVARPV